MKSGLRTRFILFHFLFLLSLLAVYFIPYVYPLVKETHLAPMNRYVRFLIIGAFSLTFLFYYLCLYYYENMSARWSGGSASPAGEDVSLFKPARLSSYFWLATVAVFLFLCSSRALLSHDLYEYSLRARMITVYNLNPYIHIPTEINNDMFFPLLFWKRTPESYGSLWVLIGALHTIFFRDSLILTTFMHKLILLIFFGLSCFVFYKVCVELKLRNTDLLTLAFFTNPLVVIMTVIDGHNEIAMIFFVLSAFYFLLRSKYTLSFVMLALSINVKFIYTLAIPLFIIYVLLARQPACRRGRNDGGQADRRANLIPRIRDIAIGGVFSLAVTLLLWLPFGMKGFVATLRYYRDLSKLFWGDSIPYAVHFLLNKAGFVISEQTMETMFSLIFFAAYIYLIYYFVRTARQDRQAIFTALSLILLVLLFTNYSGFQLWYLIWVIPVLLLSRIKSRMLLTLLLSYFLIMAFWKRMSVLAIPMTIFYVALLGLYNRNKERLGPLFLIGE